MPAKFVGSVQQVVDLGLRLLHEMAGKAQFYRDRLAQVGGRRRRPGGRAGGGVMRNRALRLAVVCLYALTAWAWGATRALGRLSCKAWMRLGG